MRIRKYFLPRNLGDFFAFVFLLCIIPFGYWFEVFLVLPSLYPTVSVSYILNVISATFLFISITSNFVYMVLMDCSVHREFMPPQKEPLWSFCEVCVTFTPPRSWHCNVCGTCILKRDHHCKFAGCCVGHQNQRFFVFFLTYLSIATVYALYMNTYFILEHTTFSGVSILKFIFPLAFLMLGLDMSVQHCYTLFYVINLLGMFSAVFVLYYHISSMIKGCVMYEKSHNIYDYDCGSVTENIKQVLGSRWHLTWISPFIHSELPHDGFHWEKFNRKQN